MPSKRSVLLLVTACAVATPAARAGDEDALSLKPLPADQWNQAAAAHLLRRAGFGGTPAEVSRLTALGLDGAVDALVEYRRIPYEIAPPPIDEMLSDELEPAKLRQMSETERQAYRQKRQMEERQAFEETRLWWLERLAGSPRPLEEKLTLFWHGHFTSGMREVKRALFMKEQNEFLRNHALDNFRELVVGISRDRAMLVYLDNARNNKITPNENYARELMELFTLGLGNYTEADVKAAARAFTGWGFDRDGFRFKEAAHDFGEKTFLKQPGNFNGDDIVRIILEQPACPRFLARKLLVFFCRPDPDKRLVDALAAEIRRHNYDLKPVLKVLFRSRAFYAADVRGSLVKSPVQLLIGSARELGQPLANLRQAERALAGMGQELLQPPNVKGWDGGRKWINTATLYNRYNVVDALIGSGEPKRAGRRGAQDEAPAEAAPNDETPAGNAAAPMAGMAARSRMGGGRQPAYDPRPLLDEQKLQTPEQIVDFYADLLLAVPLPDEKRAELVKYLAGEKNDFKPDARDATERVRRMTQLLCATPEYQMY